MRDICEPSAPMSLTYQTKCPQEKKNSQSQKSTKETKTRSRSNSNTWTEEKTDEG